MEIAGKSKEKIVVEWVGDAKNSGCSVAQIGLVTERIRNLARHMKAAHKDYSSKRGLMKLLGQRKRLISYLKRKDQKAAEEIVKKIKA